MTTFRKSTRTDQNSSLGKKLDEGVINRIAIYLKFHMFVQMSREEIISFFFCNLSLSLLTISRAMCHVCTAPPSPLNSVIHASSVFGSSKPQTVATSNKKRKTERVYVNKLKRHGSFGCSCMWLIAQGCCVSASARQTVRASCTTAVNQYNTQLYTHQHFLSVSFPLIGVHIRSNANRTRNCATCLQHRAFYISQSYETWIRHNNFDSDMTMIQILNIARYFSHRGIPGQTTCGMIPMWCARWGSRLDRMIFP